MANIRMPVDGEDFFQFVKGVPGENLSQSFFPTYAHLLASAAAVGFYQEPPAGNIEYREKQPLPIAIDIFRNQDLYDVLLLLVTVNTKDPKSAKDPDHVCRTIETLSCAGFRAMQSLYDESGPHFWLDSWEDLILKSVGEFDIGQSEDPTA